MVGSQERGHVARAIPPPLETPHVPHTRNRRAFASLDPNAVFLRLYGRCVALELALKDADPSFRGHDLLTMANRFAGDPSVNALVSHAHQDLARISCTGADGGAASVRPHLYPDLRYTRHESDFPGSGTDDATLAQALRTVTALEAELGRCGLSP